MNRSLLLAVLLVVSVLAPGISLLADGQQATVAITDVTTAPERPNPGETFRVRTTVTNGESAPGAFDITDVYVRRAGSARSFARVEDVGGVQPGGSLSVPLPMTLEDTGTYDLRVYVVGELNGTRTRLQYPLLVSVRESGPQLLVETNETVVGAQSTASVTVVNAGQTPVSTVRLAVGGQNVTVDSPNRILTGLAAGEQRTLGVPVTPTDTSATLQTVLTYTTEAGNERTVRSTTPLAPAPLERDVTLEARRLSAVADPPIGVTIRNFGNAPLDDVTVAILVDGTVVTRRPAPDVAADAERDLRVNVSDVPTGPVDVRVAYETAGTQGSEETTVQYRSNPGSVAVTGVDYEVDDGTVFVSGSVANVGLTEVNGVVVRVVSAPGIDPVRPAPDYFVGSIPASDFATFDLSVVVDEDVDTVPIEVRYLVRGERRTATTNVSVADRPAPAPEDGGGPPTLVLVGGAVIALAVVIAAVYRYRRR
ncbi:Secreted Beta-propeller repeat protein fused to CARDB-like adhesion module [Halanaeroarchaeum sp. HSR-CO]|uniref:CARDB domain-containing protein n=1 Tax=Halanaeroarchaeum sp. HSR-CO TaxID=2866382 RepID=UPI00217F02C9|nr:CARDB domain-containing protein [Halanaeroarchaeum sp. HSR-CO]UWG46786.1 Secreted Beta-propeller repeat protein fused to CARDB-like adhesion module [Halanaeroarchaeum sp. HSR-CO]